MNDRTRQALLALADRWEAEANEEDAAAAGPHRAQPNPPEEAPVYTAVALRAREDAAELRLLAEQAAALTVGPAEPIEHILADGETSHTVEGWTHLCPIFHPDGLTESSAIGYIADHYAHLLAGQPATKATDVTEVATGILMLGHFRELTQHLPADTHVVVATDAWYLNVDSVVLPETEPGTTGIQAITLFTANTFDTRQF